MQAAIYYSIGRPEYKRYLLCLSPSPLLKSQNKLDRNSGNELFLKQSDLSARALVFLAAREKGTGRLLGRPLCTRKKRSAVLSHAQGTATHSWDVNTKKPFAATLQSVLDIEEREYVAGNQQTIGTSQFKKVDSVRERGRKGAGTTRTLR